MRGEVATIMRIRRVRSADLFEQLLKLKEVLLTQGDEKMHFVITRRHHNEEVVVVVVVVAAAAANQWLPKTRIEAVRK